MRFDGSTYDPHLDCRRLSTQLEKVKQIMGDGKWRTLREIRLRFPHNLEVSEASISARLRDCRKPRFGSFTVDRRRRQAGLFEYRLKAQQEMQFQLEVSA